MSYQYIDLKIENHVATVAMARVDALNALSIEFATEIASIFRELGANDDIRAIIFCSKARIFCAGLDLKEAAGGATGTVKGVLDMIRHSQPLFDCCNFIEECPKPVIAAVNGKCIGGGLDMISACDIRLCTEDAIFCLKEANIGIVADMGVLQRLPMIIGQGFAREMAFTAANYSARDVEKMGLVNAVYADQAGLLAAAQKLAAQIAANAPLGIKSTKEVLNFSRYVNVYEGMAMAIQKNAILLMSEDMKEAVMAFLERRPADFKGKQPNNKAILGRRLQRTALHHLKLNPSFHSAEDPREIFTLQDLPKSFEMRSLGERQGIDLLSLFVIGMKL